jgi:hypothetical protein
LSEEKAVGEMLCLGGGEGGGGRGRKWREGGEGGAGGARGAGRTCVRACVRALHAPFDLPPIA